MAHSLTLKQKHHIRKVFDNTTILLEITSSEVDAILSCAYSRTPTELLEPYVWIRIGVVFRICTSVASLLGDESLVGDRVKSWIKTSNRGFAGESALSYIERDPATALVHIPEYLESVMAGDYA